VTTGHEKVYLVFYGSQWGTQSTDARGYPTYSGDPRGIATYLAEFFNGLGTGSELWSGVMTQYCEGIAAGSQICPSNAQHVAYPTGGALAGVWEDTRAASPASATATQLATEADFAAGVFGNTSPSANRDAQYFIVSPTGTTPDGFNTPSGTFCAWHDYNTDISLNPPAARSGFGDIDFTNMPYLTDAGAGCGAGFVNSPGTLDGVTIVGGHEYAETITDSNPFGGWSDSTNAENGDKCAWIQSGPGAAQNIALATGSFPVQSTWANDDNAGSGGCEIFHGLVGNGSTGPGVFRIFGSDRYATGIAMSQHAWDDRGNTSPGARHPQAVVLSRGDGFADALAGVPLAAKKSGPLLLTTPTALVPEVAGEIGRILPPGATVYLLGGPAAISGGVEAHLQRSGYRTVRFAGADRFGTALAIAQNQQAMADPPRVLVATGLNFPDALAAGPYAALPTVGAAIVLSEDRVFDPATANYVRSKLGNRYGVTGVGGQAGSALATLSRGGYGLFAGADRYATAAEIAGLGWPSAFPPYAAVGIATGVSYADALTGGAFMAARYGPIMLTDPAFLPGPTAQQLSALRSTVQEIDIFGGANAVSDGVAVQITSVVGGRRYF
jgi:serine protease